MWTSIVWRPCPGRLRIQWGAQIGNMYWYLEGTATLRRIHHSQYSTSESEFDLSQLPRPRNQHRWQGFLFQVRSEDAYCRYLLYVPLHLATANTTVSSYSDFYQDGRRLERDLTTVITSYVFFLVPKGRLHHVTRDSHGQLCCPLSGSRCGFPLIPFLVCKAHTPHHPTEEAGPLAVLARVHL